MLLTGQSKRSTIADEVMRELMLKAIKDGDRDAVDMLCMRGSKGYWKDDDGTPFLLIAAERGDVEICKLLIWSGAMHDSRDKYGNYASHIFARNGNLFGLGLCRDYELKLEGINYNDENVLHVALKNKKYRFAWCAYKHLPYTYMFSEDINKTKPIDLLPADIPFLHKSFRFLIEYKRKHQK